MTNNFFLIIFLSILLVILTVKIGDISQKIDEIEHKLQLIVDFENLNEVIAE